MKPGTKLFWHDHSFVHPVEVVEQDESLPAELYAGTVKVKHLHNRSHLWGDQFVRETELFTTESEAYAAAQAWLKSRTESVNFAIELAAKKAA